MDEGGLTGRAAFNRHGGAAVDTHNYSYFMAYRSSIGLLLAVNVTWELRASHCITNITKNTGF
jgi:hypothetical protein